MSFGQLPYDVAHVLGGIMLLVSFMLLQRRSAASLINALALQGVLLAAAAIWQGYVQGAPQLYVTGLIALLAKGIAIPLVLRRMLGGALLHREPEGGLDSTRAMLAGGLLVALAILVVLPVTAGVQALAREDLAIALSILLLGLLMMLLRRGVLAQAAGLMIMENGLILGAVGVAGMPLVIELSTAGLVLVVGMIAGLFGRLLHESFESQDTDVLHPHRGEAP
ncbi:hydrogenase-4 component E [Roseococcus sp. YIM B11640]|uniref:hydrogenase-4 component E n=1 Tax=Roseococcus sp. YIM B11640 TaxID=3133973 RepID=UPI003C7A2E91